MALALAATPGSARDTGAASSDVAGACPSGIGVRVDNLFRKLQSGQVTLGVRMSDTGFVPGGFQFLSNLAEACGGASAFLTRRPLVYRARALVDRASSSPEASGAARWLADAERDIALWSMGEADGDGKATVIEDGLMSAGIQQRMTGPASEIDRSGPYRTVRSRCMEDGAEMGLARHFGLADREAAERAASDRRWVEASRLRDAFLNPNVTVWSTDSSSRRTSQTMRRSVATSAIGGWASCSSVKASA